MGVADWLIAAFLVFSVVTAAIEGFFREAFGLVGLIAGYLIAAWQYRRLADWFEPVLKQPWLADVMSFFIIFFGVMLAAFLIGRLARGVMKEAGLTAMDRTLGGLLGLVKGSLIVAIVLVALAAFTPTSRWLQRSEFAPYFLVAGRAAIWLAPAELRQRFDQGLDYLRNVRSGQKTTPDAGSK